MLLRRGEITPPWGTPRFPEAFSISFNKCKISRSCIRRAAWASSRSCRTLSKYAARSTSITRVLFRTMAGQQHERRLVPLGHLAHGIGHQARKRPDQCGDALIDQPRRLGVAQLDLLLGVTRQQRELGPAQRLDATGRVDLVHRELQAVERELGLEGQRPSHGQDVAELDLFGLGPADGRYRAERRDDASGLQERATAHGNLPTPRGAGRLHLRPASGQKSFDNRSRYYGTSSEGAPRLHRACCTLLAWPLGGRIR